MENSVNTITETIIEAINTIFSKLYTAVDNTVYDLLDYITFIDKTIIEEKNFKIIFGENSQSGILLICNSLILGFFLFYAANYLLSHLTLKPIQKPSQFFFKAIIFIALMNSSLWFCSEIINIVFLINRAISTLSLDLFGVETSFSNFISMLNNCINKGANKFELFSFDGIIKTFASIGMINLILTYSLRYIMIQLFVLICPFAVLSLITESSEKFFKQWIKNFLSLLFIQIVLSMILLLAFSFDNTVNSSLKKMFFVAIIYAIMRANTFIKELIGGISIDVNSTIQSLK